MQALESKNTDIARLYKSYAYLPPACDGITESRKNDVAMNLCHPCTPETERKNRYAREHSNRQLTHSQ